MVVVDTCYPAFLAGHYAERPELTSAPYEAQLAALMSRRFGTSDAYSHEFTKLGHETVEVIANCQQLQLQWARENGEAALLRRLLAVPTRAGVAARYLFLHRLLQDQIRAFDPDVVYFQDLWFASRRELDRLRGEGRLVVGQIASSPPPGEVLRGFDLIVTSFPHYVDRFRALGVDSEYLPISFDARVLGEVEANGRRPYGVVFVGGVNPHVHPAGVALLERLAGRTKLDIWGYGASELPPDSPLLAAHHGEAWGLDMYRVLAGARVVINRHIEAAEGFANNMRLFESTGMGALLVTEQAPNLEDLFAPGREVAAYATEDELVDMVEHFAAHEDERSAIAAAGQARTLRDHTYERRMGELAALLEQRTKGR